MTAVVNRAASAFWWSPLLRWQYLRASADQIILEPRDLRVADPSFASELLRGVFGFAGQALVVGDGDPFAAAPPSAAWHDELHGFGWLRGVIASGDVGALDRAQSVVDRWISRHADDLTAAPWQPGIAARRVLSWLCYVGALQEGAEPEAEDRVLRTLARHLVVLGASWRLGCDGQDRILAAIARVAGDVCIEGRERHFSRSVRDLGRELHRQILADGGHISRNPDVLVDILLDLLPVQHCILARGLATPPAIEQAITHMMAMIRRLRIDRDRLACFNGGGRAGIEALASIMAHDPAPDENISEVGQSGYARIEQGRLAVLADFGSCPPVFFASSAHAGSLSIEVAVDGRCVLGNVGPGARDTASHSTLVIADTSSASLLDDAGISRRSGGVPLVQTGRAHVPTRADDLAGTVAEATHEGYVESFGLVHRRRLGIESDGTALAGLDRIEGPRSATVRLKRDLPFAIRFHLSPDVSIAGGPWPDAVNLALPAGGIWRFSAIGAHLSLEPSRRYDRFGVAVPAMQIVLRGVTFGASEISWRFAAMEPSRHA